MENGSTHAVLGADTPIDPDFALYDDQGNIIGQFGADGREAYLEGKAPVPPKTPAPAAGSENPPAQNPEPAPAADPKPNPEQKTNYANHAEFILRAGGYESDQIELEDGTLMDIAALDAEQQLNLITHEFVRMQQEYAAELQSRQPAEELSGEEKHLVDFLRNGGTARDLARYISENDPENAHRHLTDEQLVLESIRSGMPGASEEDVQEEFRILKEAGRIEKRAQLLRSRLGSGEISLADISQKHRELMETRRAKELEEETRDAEKLSQYAKTVTHIAKVPVDAAVVGTVLKDLIPESPGEDSNFLKSLNSPEKLLRMQFLDRYAEQIFEHVAAQSLREGMELERTRLNSRIEELETQLGISKKHLARFSDKPIVEFAKPKTGKAVTEPEPELF